MKKEYKNKSFGERCDGVCDYCHRYSPFIIYGWGSFCSKCAEPMMKNKIVVPVNNVLKFDYCQKCNKRDPELFNINFGFCNDCIAKLGKKDRKTGKVQGERTRVKIKRFDKKTGFKTVSSDEADRLEKLSKKCKSY